MSLLILVSLLSVKILGLAIYPTYLKQNDYGIGLYASIDIPNGTVVAKFQGKVVDSYQHISQELRIHSINFIDQNDGKLKWIILESDARYSNHACFPNCFLNDNLELETIKNVNQNEEITWIYNNRLITEEWDDLWSFECKCCSVNCQGMIDKYRLSDRFGNQIK